MDSKRTPKKFDPCSVANKFAPAAKAVPIFFREPIPYQVSDMREQVSDIREQVYHKLDRLGHTLRF